MSLAAGTRLGPYEIVAPLGAGGMGEVYRARDLKLNRDVAIKVLLPAVANDPDRLARFSREAQVLASLNHPNIAHIHGLEESNGVTALVMELVEGEDLSQRIRRGAIPIDEVLPIARQIAEALEAAHDHGIIHRDLKPANVKVRPDGTVKVLDFGLAKAIDPGAGSRQPGAADLANSPTLSNHATQAGIILGTAAYMSPEQAAGKAVDRRSDLWAFGVVLFEMLSGRQMFAGETTSHVLAAVLKDQPDWTALPANTPAPIRRLIRRCLEKDRKRRLDSAGDARLEIDEANAAPIADVARAAAPRRAATMRLALVVVGGFLIVAGAAAGWLARRPSPPEPVTFEIPTAGSRRMDGFALSPMVSKAFYSPTGHLVFRLRGRIVGQPFDPETGTVSGDPIQLTPSAMQQQTQTALAMSSGGVLAYRAGEAQTLTQLSWLDRSGKTVTTVGAAANYWNPFLEAAGERVVVNTVDGGDVWILDSQRGTTSRLTFDAATDSDAIFSPDGRSIAFYSSRQPQGIYRKASSGAGADELIAATGPATYPRDWSPDGRFLLFDSGAGSSMWALPMAGDRKPFRYPPTQPPGSQVSSGHFSPDGKWVAYMSNESVLPEIFVQDFPAGAAKFQVSAAGGSEPRWRRDGREIYYLGADGRMMAVEVETTPTFRMGLAKPLFQTQLNMLALPARRYGVSANGRRFVMNVPLGAQSIAPITVLLNWHGRLRQ